MSFGDAIFMICYIGLTFLLVGSITLMVKHNLKVKKPAFPLTSHEDLMRVMLV